MKWSLLFISIIFFLAFFFVYPPLQISADTPAPSGPPPPCTGLTNGGTGKCISVNTGIGEIKTDPAEFIKSIFGILLSLSGGIAILLIIFAGYQMIVSQGNPEKVQAARETMTAAIVGLLFTIFSFVILEVIGVDILKLPGFGH